MNQRGASTRSFVRAALATATVSCIALAGCASSGASGSSPPRRDTAAANGVERASQDDSRKPSPGPAANAVAGGSTATDPADGRLTIVTGDPRETDYQTGIDLAKYVASPAGLALDVVASKGATDNMHRLHDDHAVDLAIVQYDVLKAFTDEAARGSHAAAQIVQPLRVVSPLYTQEMYFVVRRDSPLRTIDQIRDRKINVGIVGGGSALTVASVYRQMFNVPISPGKASYLDEQQALVALTIDRSVDVVVVIAGQPARLFTEMKPAAREFIRLLAVDPALPSSKAAFRSYFPATIRAASYSQWLERDVPTLSVMSFLVTSAAKGSAVDARLDLFAQSLCRNIDVLRQQGHPKWREVDVTLRLGSGWPYSPVTSRRLERCPDDRRAAASTP